MAGNIPANQDVPYAERSDFPALATAPSDAEIMIRSESRPTGQKEAYVPASGFLKTQNKTTITLFGDSITNQCGSTSSLMFGDFGYLYWAQALSGTYIKQVNNFGVNGDTTTLALARISTALSAATGDLFVVMLGVNDVINGSSFTTITNNLTSIYNAVVAANKVLVVCTITPYTTADQNRANILASVNRWILTTAATRGYTVIDTFTPNVSPSTTRTDWLANRSNDGIHPANLGAFKVGEKLAPILSQHYPKVQLPISNVDTRYTNTLSSNRLKNPMFFGTSGIRGTGVTGQLPNDYAGLCSGAASASCALVSADSGVGNKVVATITATAASEIFQFKTPPTGENLDFHLPNGITVFAAANIVLKNAVNVKSIVLQIGNSSFSVFAGASQASAYNETLPNMTITPVTPLFVTGGTGNVFYITIMFYAAGSATLEISAPCLYDAV